MKMDKMTEKRYVQFEFPYDDFVVKDNETNEELWNPRVVDKLNEQDKTIKELNEYCTACDDTLLTIQELTYKLLSVDFAGVKSKADYCHLLNELDNKDLSFIHDCIKAINKCDLMRMEELKREYGDSE